MNGIKLKDEPLPVAHRRIDVVARHVLDRFGNENNRFEKKSEGDNGVFEEIK